MFVCHCFPSEGELAEWHAENYLKARVWNEFILARTDYCPRLEPLNFRGVDKREPGLEPRDGLAHSHTAVGIAAIYLLLNLLYASCHPCTGPPEMVYLLYHCGRTCYTNSSLILIVTEVKYTGICTVFNVPNGRTSGSKDLNSAPAFFLASRVIVRSQFNNFLFFFFSTTEVYSPL